MINQEKEIKEQAQPFSNKKRKILASVMFIFVFAIAIGLYTGKINPFNAENSNSKVYEFAAAPSGVPFKYDFAPELIPLLKTGSSAPYTFYLGSGVGFQPMGLSLDPFTGILSGTPKVSGTSKFEVCVKDVGGNSACKTYSVPVEPKTITTPKTGKTTIPTPVSNGNAIQATGFSGIWEGEMILIYNREDEAVPDCDNAESVYQLNLTQKGNKLTGTMTAAYTKRPVFCQDLVPSESIGVEYTKPITGTITGTSAKLLFDGVTSDYTLTLTGNTLIVNMVGCHNPDPRCSGVVIPSPEGSGVPDMMMDMPYWFSGESTATRKK